MTLLCAAKRASFPLVATGLCDSGDCARSACGRRPGLLHRRRSLRGAVKGRAAPAPTHLQDVRVAHQPLAPGRPRVRRRPAHGLLGTQQPAGGPQHRHRRRRATRAYARAHARVAAVGAAALALGPSWGPWAVGATRAGLVRRVQPPLVELLQRQAHPRLRRGVPVARAAHAQGHRAPGGRRGQEELGAHDASRCEHSVAARPPCRAGGLGLPALA